MRRIERGCGLSLAMFGSLAITVIGIGEAAQAGGRAWIAVGVGVVLFIASLVAISYAAKRR